MKRNILLAIPLFFVGFSNLSAQVVVTDSCIVNQGNIAIFGNYDGGFLNIDVNQDIPNLKIGIVSFAGVHVNITGAYAGNVTQVEYAGIKTNGTINCNNPTDSTTVVGVSPSIVNLALAPPHGFPTVYGENTGIYCITSCDTSIWQGGCNTYDQVEHYFETLMNGTAFLFRAQYICWPSESTIQIGGASDCGLTGTSSSTVYTTLGVSDTLICVGESISLTNTSATISSTEWTITGSNTPMSSATSLSNVSWNTPGIKQIVLSNGSCEISTTVNVQDCASLNELLLSTLSAFPNPSSGIFTIQGLDQTDDYSLSDLSGKTIDIEKQIVGESIDLSGLEKGIYLLNVTKETAERTIVLMKQ
jgi:hypothetical protein